MRERLQQVFGVGGDAYIVPGKPHIGVRSALFDSDASDGWSYEALQKSDARRRFYLSGFNAVSHHAGAALMMRSRGGRPYDRLEVAFLKAPGGGRAEVDARRRPERRDRSGRRRRRTRDDRAARQRRRSARTASTKSRSSR